MILVFSAYKLYCSFIIKYRIKPVVTGFLNSHFKTLFRSVNILKFRTIHSFIKLFFFFLRFLKFIFRGKGREGEREGEKHQCVVAFSTPPTGAHWGPGPQARHVPWLGIEPVTLCFSGTQSTEPHQSGLIKFFCLTFTEHLLYVVFVCVRESKRVHAWEKGGL